MWGYGFAENKLGSPPPPRKGTAKYIFPERGEQRVKKGSLSEGGNKKKPDNGLIGRFLNSRKNKAANKNAI